MKTDSHLGLCDRCKYKKSSFRWTCKSISHFISDFVKDRDVVVKVTECREFHEKNFYSDSTPRR